MDPGGLGYVLHRTRSVDLLVAGTVELESRCPAGKVALGAGWEGLDESGAYVRASPLSAVPSADGRAWTVRLRSEASAWRPRVSVACVSAAAVPSREVLNTGRFPATDAPTRALYYSCPAGKVAIGGGWEALDAGDHPVPVAVHQAAPDGQQWSVIATAPEGTTWWLRTLLVCVASSDLGGVERRSTTRTMVDGVAQAVTTCDAGTRPALSGWILPSESETTLGGPYPSGAEWGWIHDAEGIDGQLTQTLVCIH